MLIDRLKTLLVLVPVGMLCIVAGGWPYILFLSVLIGVSGWELWRMFHDGGYDPSLPVMVIGSVLIVGVRPFFSFAGSDLVLSACVLFTMTLALVGYEKGRDRPASDFAITIGAVVYLGWLGAYLIDLRWMENGLYWILTALPAAWLADVGAYFIGSHFGKTQMVPRLSPHKTWEGFFGGVVFSVIGCGLLGAAWNVLTPDITFLRGLLLGLVLSIVTPLGDLGESMLKRQFGVKDTSNILPGHGGILDRIDTSLWAGVISYYLITFFFL